MWDYLLMDRPYDIYQPEHTIGPALMEIMVRGKPHQLWAEWISWEDALWNSQPCIGYDPW